jgi:UDP-N-acetylmuramate--alanine ligase
MEESRRAAHAVHFIGVGGIGMSALARYFLHLGSSSKIRPKWLISGSDAAETPITRSLRKEGVDVKIGHKRAFVTPQTGLIIYNRAIPQDNPELLEARRLKIPVVPYAKVLGEITKGHTTISITGSHGKTTTTAFTGLLLIKNKFDPTIFIGSNLKELGGKNIRIGKSPYLVLEADDFGGAFLEYESKIAIVTNIDREHLDFYKTFGNLKKTFLAFLDHIDVGGVFILNRDDNNLYSLRQQITRIAKKHRATVVWYSLNDSPAPKIKKTLSIPGTHNLSNALAAYHLGRLLKIPEKNILDALSSYRGAWRRMEYRGTLKKLTKEKAVPVFDDYAHHPTEIKATLQAFREKFPQSKIVCVFQPHQAKRLEALFKEFQSAFKEADSTVILPIYAVKGRDEKTAHDSKKLVQAIKARHSKKEVHYCSSPRNLQTLLHKIVMDGQNSVLVMMGAGDIIHLTDKLLKNR